MTVIALEHFLQLIDRLHDTPEPISTFKSLYDAPGYRMLAEVISELAKIGYMRVRRVVGTPTRKIFVNPELDGNEPAFDFTPPPVAKPSNPDEIFDAETMIAFFTSYVSKDSIGAIANAHFANSDLYGINSKGLMETHFIANEG
uniref:Uncharacterized protein n=1 Tax=Panagrolaimus sp. ES5 TaxID=591445 RepID=A0AC34F920_9BILA